MNNLIQRTTDFALTIVREYIDRLSSERALTVIDATCGNGHDSLALARMLQASAKPPQGTAPSEPLQGLAHSRLIAIDIQEEAVANTRTLLMDSGFADDATGSADLEITAICDSHENISSYCDGFDIAVFNLGYLPGGDKSVTTESSSTMDAVTSALDLLNTGGLISLTLYSGHEAGAKEKAELLAFAEKLDSREFHVSYISMINQKNNPPEILLITRKK